MPWKRFYFEGNQRWGWIDSAEAWEEFVRLYAKGWDFDVERTRTRLLQAHGLPHIGDRFGFYGEYVAPTTLLDFFQEHQMPTKCEGVDA